MENKLYDYWPIISRPTLKFPNDARVAFWLGVNIEYFELDKPGATISPVTANLVPDPYNYAWRDYGPRVGIWRMMDLLDKHKLRASVLLNSDVCLYFPEIIEEGRRRSWAWLAHGRNNSIKEANMTPEQERSYLTDVVNTIEKFCGKRPKGWLGPALTETFNTPDILAELGLTYICDWCSDDQPYPLHVTRGKMISVPYSVELNDLHIFRDVGMSGEDFYKLAVDQFDVLYREGEKSGRVLAMGLHPYVINQPFRHKYLEKAIEYITSHDKVWMTTSDEIADWYYANYYDRAVSSAESRKRKI